MGFVDQKSERQKQEEAKSNEAKEAFKKSTAESLDKMLGVEEKTEVNQKDEEKSDESGPPVSVSDDVLKEILRAEKERQPIDEEAEQKIGEVFQSVKKLSNKNKLDSDDAANLQSEFESLVELLAPASIISKADTEIMKTKVFGMNSFWVTGSEPYLDMEGGWIFRGNLRGNREEVYEATERRMIELFADKYELMMVEEPETDDDMDASMDARGGPRVSFVIVPTQLVKQPEPSSWQTGIALLLAGLTVLSAIQLGLVAEVTRLPSETLSWFSSPDNVDSGAVPPGLENFDPVEYFNAAMPVTLGVLASAGAHDLAHRIMGLFRDVKLSVPFFIPNGQLGTFGSVTQIRSRIKTRTQLFDVAAAGPLAGGAVALAIFINGLALSATGDAADLVKVPSSLLQGSLLLGSLTQLVLSVDLSAAREVAVHPLLIAGWCALTTTALNLLPVGSLDGGRMVQAALGRRTLGLTGLLTYLGLALGALGASLSLPFGLYVLVTQRVPETAPRNDVTEVSQSRSSICLAALTFAIFVLLPLGADVDPSML
uniref:Peptidase M50 domain-containing protein n=1 Tax=Pyramimonas obovata TaxID=1411642 RepID=A0A7S0MVW8_9CHLO